MNQKLKFSSLSDLIGFNPENTYMGGGYRREVITIHDIEIDDKSISALCDIKNDYSETKQFHLTQPAAYSCSSQLLVAYFSFSREIKRHEEGFHIFLNDYSTKWKKIVKTPTNIPVKIREIKSSLNERTEKVNFEVSIGENSSVKANYNVVFRLPVSK